MALLPPLPQHLALKEQNLAVFLASLIPVYLYIISLDALIIKSDTQAPQTILLSFN